MVVSNSTVKLPFYTNKKVVLAESISRTSPSVIRFKCGYIRLDKIGYPVLWLDETMHADKRVRIYRKAPDTPP